MAQKSGKDEPKSLRQTSDEVVLEGKAFKNTKLLAEDLDGVNEDLIKEKISELMSLTLDASQPGQENQEKQNMVLKSLSQSTQRKPAFLRRRRN